MTAPLDGVRIVDFTTMIAGPLGTMILADQGADVVKVEEPLNSAHARRAGYTQRTFNATHVNNNRNKRSIAIDVSHPDGRQLLLDLVATADVFVQNYRPGVMGRLKIDYEDLKAVNPRLIYVSISGVGETGPYARKPVYDPIIQALSGLTTVQAGSDTERPRLMRTIVVDKVTAISSAQAIAAALFCRERTGEGQHIRLAMLDVVVAFMWSSDMGSQTFVGREVDRPRAATSIDLIYETQNGFITVGAMNNAQWEGLCRALEHPEWLEDERFLTQRGRDQHANERFALTAQGLLNKTTDEWLDILDNAGVPCSPVLRRAEMIHHPQVQNNEMIFETDHPVAGRLRQARDPVRFEGTPTDQRRKHAPDIGEHSEELCKELGYTDLQVTALKHAGIIPHEFEMQSEPNQGNFNANQ